MAPFYDVMSTLYYSTVYVREMTSTLGLFVSGKRDINEVTIEDVLLEAMRGELDARLLNRCYINF